ncbi:MAG: sigma factor-like helix-turn-helix DNA-binding protein [Planctomycetota bacterium]
MVEETQIGGDNYRFRDTLWTSIIKAKDKKTPGYQSAISCLISTYWKPVYFYIRRKGYDVENAKDLTQSFFTVFLEKEYLKSVDKEQGKFRTFILAALNHFLSGEKERLGAQKRGGGQQVLSLDFAGAETEITRGIPDKTTPEAILAKTWAQTILKNALENLRREYEAKSQLVYFNILETHLSAQSNEEESSYEDIASRFNISETDVKNYLHRVRRRYKELIKDEIRKYVSDEKGVEEELKELFVTFS